MASAGIMCLVLSTSGAALAEVAIASVVSRIGPGSPEVGRQKADDGRCLECHGVEGISGDARIPNHAGQYAAYLIKQLQDFQSGARHHEVMNVMAEDLSASDMADIGAYFASRTVMKGERFGAYPAARALFENGDAARNIEACAGCHGDDGKGKLDEKGVYPVIGGQNRVYLHSQLTGWKHANRKNSPDAVMNKIAGALRDDEIDALANYLSGL